MSKKDTKQRFLNLYDMLNYDCQQIVCNTFRCLVEYKDDNFPEKGYQAYQIKNILDKHQQELGLSNLDVCNKVSYTPIYVKLDMQTYRSLKQWDFKLSEKQHNDLLIAIADVLAFREDEYKQFKINNVISKHQKKLNLSDKEVCEKVSKTPIYKQLSLDTYRGIKKRNSQSSKNSTNWLDHIAKVLNISKADYYKNLTPEAKKESKP